MARDERTLQFMENYRRLHEKGLGMKEIIEKYGISMSQGYALLGEIASNDGVTRESLLMQPHPGYPSNRTEARTLVPAVDFDTFCERLVDLEEKVGGFNDEMKAFLRQCTERTAENGT